MPIPTLTVKFENICLFVLGDDNAQAWFIADKAHTPYLDLSTIDAPPELKQLMGPRGLPLKDWIVSFGECPDKAAPKQTYDFDGPASLGGRHVDLLINIGQVVPEAKLRDGWCLKNDEPPDMMTTRVKINGGSLEPQDIPIAEQKKPSDPRPRPGGLKSWRIGDKVTQSITDFVHWRHLVACPPYIRLRRYDATDEFVWKINAVTPDDYSVRISSLENDPKHKLEFHRGVVFVNEFASAAEAIDLGDSEIPIPHTWWPEYDDQTDPQGGPCGPFLFDKRKKD
jgi:hypothetical protein